MLRVFDSMDSAIWASSIPRCGVCLEQARQQAMATLHKECDSKASDRWVANQQKPLSQEPVALHQVTGKRRRLRASMVSAQWAKLRRRRVLLLMALLLGTGRERKRYGLTVNEVWARRLRIRRRML